MHFWTQRILGKIVVDKKNITNSQGGRVYRNIEEDNDKKQVEVLNSCENISNYLIIN